MKTRTLSLLILLAILWITSCVEEENPYTIPYSRVYFQIDINGLDSDLSFFSHKLFTQPRTVGESTGYGGLLIFRSHQGEISAYDLSCPHEKNKDIRVEPKNNGKAVCPECESVFVTMYGLGTCESGPSQNPLQKYNVRQNPQSEGAFLIVN